MIAYSGKTNVLCDLLNRVQTGALPKSEPNKFFFLCSSLYAPELLLDDTSCSFLPLKSEELDEWCAFAKSGAARFGVSLDESLFPEPLALESIIKQIEVEVFSRRGDFDFFKEQDYLKTLATLYRQCLKAGTNWELAITWGETGEGFEGMPVLHSPRQIPLVKLLCCYLSGTYLEA